MVPGVGHDGLAVDGATRAHGELEAPLLQRDAHQSCDECNPSRLCQLLSLQGSPDLHHAAVADAEAYDEERHADDGSGERLVFAVAVVVVLVLRAGAELHEDDHHGVGEQVAERVDAIGDHCGRLSEDAGDELEDNQYDIDGCTVECHACSPFLSV